MDRKTEVAHLAQAHAHIERGEKAISRQLSAINRLERSNIDTAEAVSHLQRLEDALVVMKDHRDLIVRTIQSIDAGLI